MKQLPPVLFNLLPKGFGTVAPYAFDARMDPVEESILAVQPVASAVLARAKSVFNFSPSMTCQGPRNGAFNCCVFISLQGVWMRRWSNSVMKLWKVLRSQTKLFQRYRPDNESDAEICTACGVVYAVCDLGVFERTGVRKCVRDV
jgi:hypothetical protein